MVLGSQLGEGKGYQLGQLIPSWLPRRVNTLGAGRFQLSSHLAVHASVESGLKSEYLKVISRQKKVSQRRYPPYTRRKFWRYFYYRL